MAYIDEIEEYEIKKYKVKDLKPNDKEFVKGMASMIDLVDGFIPSVEIEYNTIKKIVDEVISDVKAELMSHMFCEIDNVLINTMEKDDYYWDK